MTNWKQQEKDRYSKLAMNLREISGFAFKMEEINDYFSITLLYAGADIWVRGSTYGQENYSFFLITKDMPYIDHYAQEAVKKELAESGIAEPKKIHTLNANTKKRIQEWVNYLVQVNQELTSKSIERSEKVDKFLARAQAEGVNIKEGSKNEYSGFLDKNGLSYRFEIDSDSGYISEEIRVIYSVRKLESFLQLSDNKFVGKSE